MNIKILILSFLSIFFIFGCNNIEIRHKDTYSVIVGIGFQCKKAELRKKGADLDIDSMFETIYRYTYPNKIMILKDSLATTQAVKNELNKAVQHELAIIYFSCLSGQKKIVDDNNEKDGLDEYLRLYNGILTDNEIWNIISKSKGDVFIIFDTDHSESMLRNIPLKKDTIQPNILCWCSCLESDSIKYTGFGSKLTNSIYFKVNKLMTYNELYDKIEKSLSKKQKINKTVIGISFEDNVVFH